MRAFLLAFQLVILSCSIRADGVRSTDAVVRDDVVYVPIHEVGRHFGVRFSGVHDLRLLVVSDEEHSFCVSFDDSAALIEGKVYVPLTLLEENLRITATIDRDSDTLVLSRRDVNLTANLRFTGDRPPTSAETIRLPVYKYTPPDAESEVTMTEIDPRKTALLVIDFWDLGIAQDVSLENTASLISLARRHGIPVIHLPHDEVKRYGLNPRALPVPDDEPVMDGRRLIEQYFETNRMQIDTLLYAGYVTSECILFTRPNSFMRVARRASGSFKMILIKDATSAPYWSYDFTVNGLETRFMTSTVNDLAGAFGEPKIARALPPVNVNAHSPAPYRVDQTFGTRLDPQHTALVIINGWECDDDPHWSERIRSNNEHNLVPLLDYARSTGMNVIHVPNGRRIAPALAPLPGEAALVTLTEVRDYIADHQIHMLMYAGNLINTTAVFPPIDLIAFSGDLSPTVQSRYLEDCLVVFEMSDSLKGEYFKKVFLERVTVYKGRDHVVTRFSILQNNNGAAAAAE